MLPAIRPELPAPAVEPRNFRPARDWTVGEEHRAEVVATLRFGGDLLIVCRGLDAPHFFELWTPRPVAEGDRGRVRCLAALRRQGPTWVFTPDA